MLDHEPSVIARSGFCAEAIQGIASAKTVSQRHSSDDIHQDIPSKALSAFERELQGRQGERAPCPLMLIVNA